MKNKHTSHMIRNKFKKSPPYICSCSLPNGNKNKSPRCCSHPKWSRRMDYKICAQYEINNY